MWGHQAVLSRVILRELREDSADTEKNLLNREFALITQFIVFRMHSIISTTLFLLTIYISYPSIYAKHCKPVIYSLSWERSALQGTVFTLEELLPSQLVSHPMPEHDDKLSSSVWLKPGFLSLTAINHADHVWDPGYFGIESAVDFFILTTISFQGSSSLYSHHMITSGIYHIMRYRSRCAIYPVRDDTLRGYDIWVAR